jgi:uncharacterized alkaline shock family protein YloU
MSAENPKISPEVLSTGVWDVLKSVPGVIDLHRHPLQGIEERVRLDWHDSVRLTDEHGVHVLEVHLVVAAGRPIQPVAQQARRVVSEYAERALGLASIDVRVFIDDIADVPAAG